MTPYDLDTILEFGKYEGATLRKIFLNDPAYIDWCLVHVDDFYLPEAVQAEFRELNPNHRFSSDARKALFQKADQYFFESDRKLRPQDFEKNEGAGEEGLLDDFGL